MTEYTSQCSSDSIFHKIICHQLILNMCNCINIRPFSSNYHSPCNSATLVSSPLRYLSAVTSVSRRRPTVELYRYSKYTVPITKNARTTALTGKPPLCIVTLEIDSATAKIVYLSPSCHLSDEGPPFITTWRRVIFDSACHRLALAQ